MYNLPLIIEIESYFLARLSCKRSPIQCMFNNLVDEKLKNAIIVQYLDANCMYFITCDIVFFLFFRCHDRSHYDLSWLRSKNRLATSGLSYSFGLFCILLIHVYLFHCGSGNLKSGVLKQRAYRCEQACHVHSKLKSSVDIFHLGANKVYFLRL